MLDIRWMALSKEAVVWELLKVLELGVESRDDYDGDSRSDGERGCQRFAMTIGR